MDVVHIDGSTGLTETLYTHSVGNVFTYVKAINKDEFVVFFYGQDIPEERKLTQYVIKINLNSQECKVLYRGEIMNWESNDKSTRDIWAIDVYNENVYLLLHQLINGKMTTHLRCISKNGDAVSDVELNALEKYSDKNQTAHSIVVEENHIFINYSNSAKDAPFVILKRNGSNYEMLEMENYYPKNLLIPNLIDGKYLVFDTYQDDWKNKGSNKRSYDLFIFDVETDTAKLLKTEVDSIGSMWGDLNGNLLVTHTTEGLDDKFYYFRKETYSS